MIKLLQQFTPSVTGSCTCKWVVHFHYMRLVPFQAIIHRNLYKSISICIHLIRCHTQVTWSRQLTLDQIVEQLTKINVRQLYILPA